MLIAKEIGGVQNGRFEIAVGGVLGRRGRRAGLCGHHDCCDDGGLGETAEGSKEEQRKVIIHYGKR